VTSVKPMIMFKPCQGQIVCSHIEDLDNFKSYRGLCEQGDQACHMTVFIIMSGMCGSF